MLNPPAFALAAALWIFPPVALAQSTSSTVFTDPDVSYLNEALESPDGTLVVTGQSVTTGAFVARLAPDGQPLWCETLNDGSHLRDHDIAANGDILVCGSFEGGGIVMRLDPAGSVLWKTVLPFIFFGGEKFLTRNFLAITELSTGQVVLGGVAADNDYTAPMYAAFDAQGTVLWWELHGEGGITDVVELPNGDIAFAGKGYDFTLLTRLAVDGSLIGMRVFLGLEGSRPQIAPSSDGHVLLVPGSGPCNWPYSADPRCFGDVDAAVQPPELLKVDYAGTVLWHKTFGSDAGSAVDLVPTEDGGAVVLGERRRGTNDGDLVLLQVNGQGNVQWQVGYGTPLPQEAAALSRAQDGSLLCTGRSALTPIAGPSPLFLRTDAQGTVASCAGEVLSPESTDTSTFSLFASPFHSPGVPTAEDPAVAFTARTLATQSICLGPPSVGSAYCSPAAPNSSGKPAQIQVQGSAVVADQAITLTLLDGPIGSVGFFLAGMGTATLTPPGSQGTICLGGSPIFRFSLLAQSTDGRGAFAITLQTPSIPNHGAILAGETWNFQAWFRDVNPTVTSNLSHATSVQFL